MQAEKLKIFLVEYYRVAHDDTMKRKIKRNRTEKMSISLPPDLIAWLREEAETDSMGNVSAKIRDYLTPIMREHRPKYGQTPPEKKD
jgi:hypothetical protein